ncbi:MAG: 16S rRNA (guanine(966)-N(2))-methyltransferase RsmD [cyanobacterium endosymbiont of Rhopalodia musculus]|uniref:16S rRNA (guanine(966)-N(2))-methyltransferase RsmD n=1 Tax=cyanobacterium endosymbiont of Epithemia clementina EcSB TaxID=3034674 RepID=UPI002480542F|nr:16S rRNA (guanine(966)-N(2))-methyltransferase RsmD [cyanobacterium endosymbiont of Epithemia clementina EcSB]WGT67592.1 16S rRNA (guanine(966)-N(2))-methyltransferase RsmD [cyanobacterium endosymbiont of Epithemia clementina EcSB]
MRIYGNRLLTTLPGQLTRPTSAKVREALFNIWQGSIIECRWLDLCAGNGSMGAEALCRGASEVIGIEKYGKACKIIKQNWQKFAAENQNFKVIKGDILKILKTLEGQQFNHIYFDPPYASKLYQPVLEAIATHKLLRKDGEIAVEHNPKLWQAIAINGLEIRQEKYYGNKSITFYVLQYS